MSSQVIKSDCRPAVDLWRQLWYDATGIALTEAHLQPIYSAYQALSEAEKSAIADDGAIRVMLALTKSFERE
jgi:hypothetical protein